MAETKYTAEELTQAFEEGQKVFEDAVDGIARIFGLCTEVAELIDLNRKSSNPDLEKLADSLMKLLSFVKEDMLSLLKYRDFIDPLEKIAEGIRRDLRFLNVQLPEEGAPVN